MIFVTVGSQKFQFNRLLQHIDDLVENQMLQDKIFAQTGYSDYKPKNYDFKDFIDREEFQKRLTDSQIVITHGGTGTIMGAVKAGKKVIAVARLKEYGEHVDDHQVQIISQLIAKKIILGVNQLEEMEAAIVNSNTALLKSYNSNTKAIIDSIDNYISQITKKK